MSRRRLAWIALFALLLGLAASWGVGSYLSRPVTRPVQAPAAPARVVRLVAADGTRLEGSFWPGAHRDSPAVLLLHGIDGSRDQFSRHAPWLNRLGYAVLAIDFRGHGRSAAVSRSFGLREALDAKTALAFLRADSPARRVGVIGISLGGAAALLGDEGPLPVQAIVLQAVYPDLRTAIANRIARVAGRPVAWIGEPLLSYQSLIRLRAWPDRLAPREAIRRVAAPVLVVGGTADRSTTVADTRSLFASSAGPKRLWLVDGADHVAISNLWSETYRGRIRCIFAHTLGEPRPAQGEPVCEPEPFTSGP